jgi:hypothetical protein
VAIAIVGHNQMMMDFCSAGRPPKPNNNAVLEKLFLLEYRRDDAARRATTVLREAAGRCPRVMDAPDGRAAMDGLARDDVRTCGAPFDVARFLGFPPPDEPEEREREEEDQQAAATASGGVESPCVALALGEAAFPIDPLFLAPPRGSGAAPGGDGAEAHLEL